MSNNDNTPAFKGYGIEPGELGQPVKMREYVPFLPKVKKPDYTIYITLGSNQVIGLAPQEPEGPEHLVIWDENRQTAINLGVATKKRLQAISAYLQDLEIHAK